MNRLLKMAIFLIAAIFFMNCGGGKKLTVEKYNQMPPEEKISYLVEQTQKNPNDLQLKRQLYQEYLNVGDQDRALAVMEQMIQIDPNQVDMMFEYGEMQYHSGNSQQAYRAFLRVMESSSADVYLSRVASYVSGGNYIIQQLTTSDADEGSPSFSPDGKKIVYQKKDGDNWDIYEVDLETKIETPLIITPADEELPVYSPDGLSVAFTTTANDRRPIDSNYKVREVATVALRDKFTRNLTQSFADDWHPNYSHNGEFITFVSDRNDLRKVSFVAKQSDIYIMESDGDFQQQLTETQANEGGAVFSPDSKQIFFHSDRNGNYDIFVMRNNGSKVLTLVDQPGNDVNPYPSPDGKYLTFVSDRSGNFEIYRCKVNGENQEQVTFNSGIDANPAFSPDGNAIAFHSNRNGNYDIFIANLTEESSGDVTTSGIIQRLKSLIN